MDSRLTDLDALCQEVRHPLSRSYIDEAVKAYRAGSLKAAIVSTYVAVTFDIIAKIRELADSGDPQAQAFVTTHNQNVGTSNITRLLTIEGNLLDDAEEKFEFVDPISRRHFDRLKQDRNLCAHPSFTVDGPLFAPEPELVRLYIVEAVRNLLAHPPTMGKTVLDRLDRDIKGAAFPTTEDQVTRFVINRYLANSRASARSSVGSVLAKALLRSTPPGWAERIHLVPAALEAVRTHDPSLWANTLLSEIAFLIDSAEEDYLPNAIGLMVRFQELRPRVPETAKARLLALIDGLRPASTKVALFAAVNLPEYAAKIISQFALMERAIKVAILANYLHLSFWPAALETFGRAQSFRGAENLMTDLIMPFAPIATPSEVRGLLGEVTTNDQIFHAAGIPGDLAEFIEAVGQRHNLTPSDAQEFLTFVDESPRPERFKRTFREALKLLNVEVAEEEDE